MNRILILSLILLPFGNLFSQSKAIDSSCWYKWPSIEATGISPNGLFIKYILLNSEGIEKQLIVTRNNGKILFTNTSITLNAPSRFSQDSKYFIFKTEKDTACILNLETDVLNKIPNIYYLNSFDVGKETWLEYKTTEHLNASFLMNLNKNEKIQFPYCDFSFITDFGALLYTNAKDSNSFSVLRYFDFRTRSLKEIKKWENSILSNFIFDGKENVLFKVQKLNTEGYNDFWKYNIKNGNINLAFNDSALLKDHGFIINDLTRFSIDRHRVFFTCLKADEKGTSPNNSLVNIWRSTDSKLLVETGYGTNQTLYQGICNIESRVFLQLTKKDEIFKPLGFLNDNSGIIQFNNAGKGETSQYQGELPIYYLISTVTGNRKKLDRPYSSSSPTGRYLLYYDSDKSNYFSYDIYLDTLVNITKGINCDWTVFGDDHVYGGKLPRGILGWLADDKSILIYDKYDVWNIDPSGKKSPINLTNGYGARHNIVFSWTFPRLNTYLRSTEKLVLTGFNVINKDNGFFKVKKKGDPECLIFSNRIYDGSNVYTIPGECKAKPQEAENNAGYLVSICSAESFPNLYFSKDLRSYHQLTFLTPEQNYNWYKSELLNCKSTDGDSAVGILYKPKNFNSKNRYPVIIYYYDKLSDRLNAYLRPEHSGNGLNVPSFVSKGYLVLTLDINFKVGHPGESALKAVTAAFSELSKLDFVDSTKVGLQGISFGGYLTNYIITHTKIFAAACTQAGVSELISDYLRIRDDHSNYSYYETGQGRIGHTLWDSPQSFIENSPIFFVNNVITPILLFHGKEDKAVPFTQAMEFFLGLRRMRKKAWLLEYKDILHAADGEAAHDFTLRLNQFFDYYLKGEQPAKWIKGD